MPIKPKTQAKQLSSETQQVLGGNKNQAIGEMSGGTAFGTVEGSVSIIYNYYYHSESGYLESVESTATDGDVNLPCPYRGLFHFSPTDAEFFFGREVFVEELFAATQTCNFIPVLGASGSGKSSVVLAGLVPKLQNEGHWLFTHFRPDSDPFHALALALVPLYTQNLSNTGRLAEARELTEYLQNGKVLLADVFAQIHQNHPTDRVLLIADQFEEIYTLCTEQKIRLSFLDTLLASFPSCPSQSQHKRVLIATMRADFLGNALLYPPFGDLLKTDIKLIRSMNYEELKQVIVKPAEKLGVTFQEGLVKRILGHVESEPGNLPLLEFALTELWKRRKGKQLTHAAYEDIGEVQGALARHANEKYGNLTDNEKEKVRRIFIQLVRPGEGTEDTRRLATKAELGEASWGLVKQLADARLVVSSRNPEEQETVEVVHEALIRNWSQLRQWMDADRSFRAWQDRLRIGIHQWKQTQRDEGALLRGVALADAEEKLKQRREDLCEEEQEFIQASGALRHQEQKEQERRRWSEEINQINTLAQVSDGFLYSDRRKAIKSSVMAAEKMLGLPWVDANTRTQVELALLNTVHNVAAPNTLGGHANSVNKVSFSLDGKMLASASADNTVKLWDTSTWKEIQTLTGHTNEVSGVSFSSNGKVLATASFDSTVKLWDTATGKEIQTLSGHVNSVNGVSFSPDGNVLASASSDTTVKLWDTFTGKEIQTLNSYTEEVTWVSFSLDGKMLASSSSDSVKLWDTATGKEIQTLTGHNNSVNGVSFSPDGKVLASASFDNTVKLWDTATGKEVQTLTGHNDSVNGVSFSPDGKVLATASDDNTVKLWDTATGKEIQTLTGYNDSVNGVSFSPDGKVLASASFDNTVNLWDTSTWNEIQTLSSHTEGVSGVSFSPNGKILASSSGDNTVKLWDTSTGKEIQTLTGHIHWLSGVSFSPNGKMLASSSGDNTVKLWDTSTGQEIKTLTGHNGNAVWGVSFSPDGKMLASAGFDKTVKLWDTSTGQEIQTLTGHTNWVGGISFSRDGKVLASASFDKTVKLWDTSTGQEIQTLTGHTEGVYSVSFSPNGKILASASSDKTVKLWDTSTGQEIQTLTGHTKLVQCISFSPNGKMLASASDDSTVKLWRWDFDYLLKEGRNFMREYFKTNPPDNESDKLWYDGVLPASASVNIPAELNALREILAKLETSDRRKIDNAFEDAQEELNKPQPDKNEVGKVLDRAFDYAKKVEGFASTIAKLQPHITNITAWLGDNWGQRFLYM